MTRTVMTFGTFDVFHVGHLRVHLGAPGPQRVGRLLQGRLRAPAHHDLGAVRGEAGRDGPAQPAPAAGDDRHLPGEVEQAAHRLAPCLTSFCAKLQRCTSLGPS